MGKHGVIDNARKRCRCGRLKPATRTACFVCRPKNSRIDQRESTMEPYTLADRVAQARACGIGYGHLMQLVELGAALPYKQPVEWPRGSAHVGEA